MNFKLSLSLASLFLAYSSFASADTLTGTTDAISAVMDREPNGQHVVMTGSFSFTTPTNGVVELSDLTAFNVSLTSQFGYNWGVTEPIYTFTGNLSDLQSFNFNLSTDILTLTEGVLGVGTNDPETLTMGATPAAIGSYPEVAAFETAWGPADPTTLPASASSAPEPRYALFTGVLLSGFGLLRWRSRKGVAK